MRTQRPAGNRTQRDNWQRLSSVLSSELLLAAVEVDTAGRASIRSVPWGQYWHRAEFSALEGMKPSLDALRWARAAYIESGFQLRLAVPYCYAYFSLLRRTLESADEGQTNLRFLRAVLGFECAAVRWREQSALLAVLSSTVRNPVYLLARLREPKAYEDPKFLPLATVVDPESGSTARAPLFYHYRQFSAGAMAAFRFLVCLPVEANSRPEAFKCLQALGGAFTVKRDARVAQRSDRIARLAVGPILKRVLDEADCSTEPEIRIADLGACSGDLTRRILERVVGSFPRAVRGRRFSWTMVDFGFADARRHASNRAFFRILAEMRCVRADYVSWIQRRSANADDRPFHVILLCRLLNNASQFSVGWVDDWHQVRKLARRALDFYGWREGAYLPHVALRHSGLRPPDLLASNGRVPLLNGATFCQLSLSDYYRGLHMLTERPPPPDICRYAVFFPIRRFNEASLELPGGGSVLESLCAFSHAVVIEDVDLTSRILRRHMASRRLVDLVASDATDRSRMHTANLLCVAPKRHASILPGRRVW